ETPSTKSRTVAPASAVPENDSVVSLVRLSMALVPVSLAASRSGTDGADGSVVSIVTVSGPEAALELPAASVARAVIEWEPGERDDAEIVHDPAAAVTALPATPSTNSCTVAPASAVPENDSVVRLVTLSVLLVPLSLAASRSGTDGGAGDVRSTVTVNGAEATLALPAASVAVAVMECAPSDTPGAESVHEVPAIVASATCVPSTSSRTVDPASAVPENESVVSFVTLSLLLAPESLAASRSGAGGVAGGVRSTVTGSAPEARLALPAASVETAVTEWTPSVSDDATIVQLPPVAVVVAPATPSTKSCTVDPASAEPLKESVVRLVRLSVLLAPLSLAGLRSGVDGDAGADVSMVTESAPEGDPRFPARSVARAVME